MKPEEYLEKARNATIKIFHEGELLMERPVLNTERPSAEKINSLNNREHYGSVKFQDMVEFNITEPVDTDYAELWYDDILVASRRHFDIRLLPYDTLTWTFDFTVVWTTKGVYIES